MILILYLKIFLISIIGLKKDKILFELTTKEVSKNETSFVVNYNLIQNFQNNKELDEVKKLMTEQKYSVALKILLSLQEKYKVENDYLYAESLLLTSEIYESIHNYKVAIKYAKKGLSTINTIDKVDNSDNISNFQKLKFVNKVGSLYHKLLVSENPNSEIYKDSAKYFYKKIENYPTLDNASLSIKASCFSNLAGIYERDSIYYIAESYSLKAIDIHKALGDKLGLSKAINNYGNINLSQGKFYVAKSNYLEAINLIKDDESANAVQTKADLYFNLAWAMRNLKEFEAYDYQEKSYNLTDRIREKEVRKLVEEIAAEYNVDNVRKEEVNKRLLAERNFWVYFAISIIIIISLTFFAIIYYQRRKTLAFKLKETQLIQQQKIENLKTEMQNRILSAAIDSKEKERKEISEILHDSVSALLSSANLHLQATKSRFNGSTPEEIEKTQAILSEASTKVRNLSHSLISSTLLKFGLQFAVKDLAQKFSNSKLKITYEIKDIKRYSEKFEIKIHNILQECINNIIKHSDATHAEIKLLEQSGNLILMVVDNGKGFDKTKIMSQNGIGISEIEVRVNMMKGSFIIDSIENEGTKVFIKVPIVEKNKTTISA